MIKTIRLIEYMAILQNKEEFLSNYESEKKAVMNNIEKELDRGNAGSIKVLVDDVRDMAEESHFLLGLYYGTLIATLINKPMTLPDEY